MPRKEKNSQALPATLRYRWRLGSSGFTKKAPSGILPLTLGISLVMASICTAMILFSYFNHVAYTMLSYPRQLRANARSGLNYLLGMPNTHPFPTTTLDLYGNGNDSVTLRKSHWGLYTLLAAKAWRGQHSFSQAVIAGHTPSILQQSALYLADHHNTLHVSGKSRIAGTAYLPSGGVKPGHIPEKPFRGKHLIVGQEKRSGKGMPPLSSALLRRLAAMATTQYAWPAGSFRRIKHLEDHHSHPPGPFGANYFFQSPSVEIDGELPGKLVVQSQSTIFVGESARLQGAILVGHDIHISAGFVGSLQAIATHTILVGDSAVLQYPSALALLPKAAAPSPGIELMPGARVDGDVLVASREGSPVGKGGLAIHANAQVMGHVYVSGGVALHGRVLGHLACDHLIHKSGTGLHANHIIDATIDYTRKSTHVSATGLSDGQSALIPMLWLN